MSSGDRSALAFAFFIAQLEKREDLERRIVVVDDPFTSQDNSRKEATLNMLRDLAEKVGQMVISSHDPLFLRSMCESKLNAKRRGFEIKFARKDGARIAAIDIAAAARDYVSRCESRLWEYYENEEGEPEVVARDLRIFLEPRLKARFSHVIKKQDLPLGDFVNLLRQEELLDANTIENCKKINSHASTFRHSEGFDSAPNPVDPNELETMIACALELTKRLYSAHNAGRQPAPSGSAPAAQ